MIITSCSRTFKTHHSHIYLRRDLKFLYRFPNYSAFGSTYVYISLSCSFIGLEGKVSHLLRLTEKIAISHQRIVLAVKLSGMNHIWKIIRYEYSSCAFWKGCTLLLDLVLHRIYRYFIWFHGIPSTIIVHLIPKNYLNEIRVITCACACHSTIQVILPLIIHECLISRQLSLPPFY